MVVTDGQNEGIWGRISPLARKIYWIYAALVLGIIGSALLFKFFH